MSEWGSHKKYSKLAIKNNFETLKHGQIVATELSRAQLCPWHSNCVRTVSGLGIGWVAALMVWRSWLSFSRKDSRPLLNTNFFVLSKIFAKFDADELEAWHDMKRNSVRDGDKLCPVTWDAEELEAWHEEEQCYTRRSKNWPHMLFFTFIEQLEFKNWK